MKHMDDAFVTNEKFDIAMEHISKSYVSNERFDAAMKHIDETFVTNKRFDDMMDAIGARFDQNEAKMEEYHEENKELFAKVLRMLEKMEDDHSTLTEHGRRIKKLEKAVGIPSPV